MNLLQELQQRSRIACTPFEEEIDSVYEAIRAYCLHVADKGYVKVSIDIFELEEMYDINCRSTARIDAFARAMSRVREAGVEVTYDSRAGDYALNWGNHD